MIWIEGEYAHAGFQGVGDFINMPDAALDLAVPASLQDIELSRIWVHEARHLWQFDNAPDLDYPDDERDAHAFTLPLYDLCAHTVPGSEQERLGHYRNVNREWSINPPPPSSPR